MPETPSSSSSSPSSSSSSSFSPPAPASVPGGPAATALGATPDIVSHILSFLPQSALAQTLCVSKMYFHLSAPLLYHTIDIRHGMRDISIGSTRSDEDDLTLESSLILNSSLKIDKLSKPGVPKSGDGRNSHHHDFSKNSLLKLVKRVNVHIHGKNECPFVSNYIQPFPNLQVLHLAGGERPSDMESDEVCAYDNSYYGRRSDQTRCQFVHKVCVNARQVVLRSLDSSPIKGYEKVEQVVIKLRPCQLPRYTRPRGLISVTDDGQYQPQQSTANDDDLDVVPVRLPLSVRSIDIVWWDERHRHRLEGYQVTLDEDSSFWMGRGGSIGGRKLRFLGCTYCDETGCIRHSPHAGAQLPGMMRLLGRDTGVERVRVWNVDYTAEEQWSDGRLSLGELKKEMARGLQQGREARMKLRTKGSSQANGNVGIENASASDSLQDTEPNTPDHDQSTFVTGLDSPLPVLSFHSAKEYFARATDSLVRDGMNMDGDTDTDTDIGIGPDAEIKVVCEIDSEEEPYWVSRIKPPRRLQDLRERVEAIWPMDDKRMLSLWSADELETYLDNYERDLEPEEEGGA
ncbi:hypothetical protein I316_02892 [Kwoniella heveanensis BCC8398]|uniref:F-box domain-containing protein n=1 Tax=Kwoniella heveanensis BCC8398 TaxID=1296120 RepID=A0A1B9GWD4_9TREE|nr:hypothetical protein I316_02892 [Kwoniella heveanensis BCC8398]